MFASLAEGVSRITGFLEGEDTRATARAFVQMGVRIEAPRASERIVHGVGLHGLLSPSAPVDCGNAGTGMRLLAGLLAGQRFDSTLVGDESLSRRPMRRVIEPLVQMGANIAAQPGGLPPLEIAGRQDLHGIDYTLPVASAQVKSAILLASLYASGETRVTEPHPTRDYTERMLATFGWPIEFSAGWARLGGRHRLHATDVVVPADFSSAAFFVVAATLVPGSELLLRDVGMNPRRTGLLQALRAMGADIRLENARELGGEAVADISVRHAPLRGIDVPVEIVADMIDEFPILFVAAAAASGTTRVRGAAELRVKESDRIAVMAKGLRVLGIEVEETPDGAAIRGGQVGFGKVDSSGDHRCAMSFVVAGLIARGAVRIRDCTNVATSFPDFTTLGNRCGFSIEEART
jgi:3-phosphoshikimate 1-carboxyvinyltransferase